jgi:nudix-type nucleoside diphosphatase (YffH/AdpP family)
MPIEIENIETIHKGWSNYSIAHIRMPGGQRFKREIEDHGNAIAVLPYDPVRRRAILVRQFRAPVFLKAKEPDLLEVIAGILDEDDAGDAARREAQEETGLALGELEHVGRFWASPGICTERMDLFLAPYARGDRTGEGGGLAHEHEEITVVELSLQELAAAADGGTLVDMKSFALVQSLRLRHPDLFGRDPAEA